MQSTYMAPGEIDTHPREPLEHLRLLEVNVNKNTERSHHTTAYNTVFFLIILLTLLSGTLFSWLQLHNQSQTEYLIYYDFWRNFSALQNGHDLYAFVFHNVHLYLLISAVWFFDLLASSGTLKLSHIYVDFFTITSFLCLFLVLRRDHTHTGVSSSWTTFIAILLACIWLNPANSQCFSYPLLDILGATLLFLLCLTGFLFSSSRSTPNHHNSILTWIAYTVVVVAGFITLESYLIVPIAISAYELKQSNTKRATYHFLLATFLGMLYVATIPALPKTQVQVDRHFLPFLHNFLVLLSGHFGSTLIALGDKPKPAGNVSILLSLFQLGCFAYLFKRSNRHSNIPMSLLLACFGFASIALATWLRYSDKFIYLPVDRYIPYSSMASMALLYQASLLRPINRTNKFIRNGVIFIILFFTAAETTALVTRNYNSGKIMVTARLEMPIYAQKPGLERNLGPSEPDLGRKWRLDLYSFLKDHSWSVFASDAYQLLGTIIPKKSITEQLKCIISHPDIETRGSTKILRANLIGVSSDGFMFTANQSHQITSFGFTAKITPFSKYQSTLLLLNNGDENEVYWAEVHNGKIVKSLPCGTFNAN